MKTWNKHFNPRSPCGERQFALCVDIPAENEEASREYRKCNGEVVARRLNPDFSDDGRAYISADKITEALLITCFGWTEVDLINRALSDCEFVR